MQGINRLDSFLQDIIKDKSKELLIEIILVKVHAKAKDVYGPLARVGSYVEGINSSRNKTADVNIGEFLICTEQTVLLLGQVINFLSWHWRYKVLCSLMSNSDLESLLKERSGKMGDKYHVYSKDFGRFNNEIYKTRNQTMAILKPSMPVHQMSQCTKEWWGERNRTNFWTQSMFPCLENPKFHAFLPIQTLHKSTQ